MKENSKKRTRWEMELDNINPDGSLKKSPGGWPSEKKIEEVQKKMYSFKERLNKEDPRILAKLVPYIKEYLNNFGALTGNIEYGVPKHFDRGEHIVESKYNFLDKKVKGSIKLGRNELTDYKSFIEEDFAFYFPENKVKFSGEGNVTLESKVKW